jgi:hypothetical protein
LHKIFLEVGHISLYPNLMDLAGDEIRLSLPGFQTQFLPPAVKHHQLLHLGVVPQAKLDGVAKIMLPKLGEVLKAAEVGDFEAIAVDSDACEHPLARDGHEFLEPANLVNNVSIFTRVEFFTEFKHS